MRLFRQGIGPHDLAVTMAGVKMGDRLLQLGCGDGRLFAALATKVGLTGRALTVDEDHSACARAGAAAEKAGVYIEVETTSYSHLPCDDESFDVAVLRNVIGTRSPEQRVACLREVLRVLRPGGRCVVVEPAPRGGLGRAVPIAERQSALRRVGRCRSSARRRGLSRRQAPGRAGRPGVFRGRQAREMTPVGFVPRRA